MRDKGSILGVKITGALLLAALPLLSTVHGNAAEPAAYQIVPGVAGNLNSVGSDTLNNLMTYWAESFGKHYPNVKIQVEGKGSATAPPALAEGTAQIGPMSRKMKAEEEEAIERKHGVKPTRVDVALDCLNTPRSLAEWPPTPRGCFPIASVP